MHANHSDRWNLSSRVLSRAVGKKAIANTTTKGLRCGRRGVSLLLRCEWGYGLNLSPIMRLVVLVKPGLAARSSACASRAPAHCTRHTCNCCMHASEAQPVGYLSVLVHQRGDDVLASAPVGLTVEHQLVGRIVGPACFTRPHLARLARLHRWEDTRCALVALLPALYLDDSVGRERVDDLLAAVDLALELPLADVLLLRIR